MAWTRHETFHSTIHEGWVRDDNLLDNLAATAMRLKDWNCDTFGNIFRRKRKLLARLSGIQNTLANSAPTRILKLEAKPLGELDEVLR